MRAIIPDASLFTTVRDGTTVSYIAPDNRSGDQILPAHDSCPSDGIRVHEEVRIERV